MGMRPRRKSAEADASEELVTRKAVTHGYPDNELGHFRHHPTYSIRGAMRYILVLSLLLWWLPTMGQMIAGYVGGRRAGGPWRGVLAAILPVAFIVLLNWGAARGYLSPWLTTLTTIPTATGHAVAGLIPPAAPYVDFVLSYLGTFVAALESTVAMGTNGYLVTIVFAYIGGIVADQARREVGAGRGTSVGISISQPLLGGFRRPYPEWEGERGPHFAEMRKIPVRPAAAAPEAPASRPKPHKVDAHPADSGAKEGLRPAGTAKAEAKPPERKELTPHDKEVATRRFVERALKQYEAAHRR